MSARWRTPAIEERVYSDEMEPVFKGTRWRRKRLVPDRPDVGPHVGDFVRAEGQCRGRARHGRVLLKWHRVNTGYVQRTCPRCHSEENARSWAVRKDVQLRAKRERKLRERERSLQTRDEVTQFILDGLGR